MNQRATPTETRRETAIAILPYYLKSKVGLGDILLDDLDWPIGRPDGLKGARISDLDATDQLLTYPRFWTYRPMPANIRARLSLMLVEPWAFHRHHYLLARLFHRRFHRILTCDKRLIAAIPNGIFYVFGDSWAKDWRTADRRKTRMLSLIASKKKALKGHKLRHRIARRLTETGKEADLIGGGYRPFLDKSEGLAPYRYSVVIENSRQPGYFTEKLVDALLLETVPIYWGAPDIADFFNPDGMMICQTEAEILKAVADMSEADYQARAAALAENRKTAARYADAAKSAAVVLGNNL